MRGLLLFAMRRAVGGGEYASAAKRSIDDLDHLRLEPLLGETRRERV